MMTESTPTNALLGEIISIGVAFSWTLAALSSEIGSKHLGVFVMNVWRMALALIFSCLLCFVLLGSPFPIYASLQTWGWLLLSGVVGYFFGDWCLFNSYLTIGSRYGQLFMTLAPMFTAFAAWGTLGQTLSWKAILAMTITITGIAISIMGRGEGKSLFNIQLPAKGILFGIGAGMGQGIGYVLSKIGMDHYIADVPATVLPSIIDKLPFASNLIRCVAGLICFSLWLVMRGELPRLRHSIHDHRGLLSMLVAVFSGPVIGVGFSLMAANYVEAGIASTIMAMTPIIILLPSHWLFHQPVTLKGIIGAVVSVIGVSLFFLL